MRNFLSILFLLIFVTVHGQQVKISGLAPGYVGKTIEAFAVQDYFSLKKERIATSTVNADSTFTLYLKSPQTQKLVIKSDNNKGFMFVQPDANYKILFPKSDKYAPNRKNGNDVEVAFFGLDSTDINYKILGFQRWVDHFIGNFYHLKSVDAVEFASALDRFKANAEKAYMDDTSTYFKVHVKFTMAGLDNINHAAERNRYEKYDFYLRKMPVQYKNEAYMMYINDFYQKMIPRLSNEANQAVYEGVLKSSPSLVMRALGSEYTLENLRMRELIMIKMLSEAYSMNDFPQTNIITILDSLSNRTFYPENKVVAKNLLGRITELVPGGQAPSFVLVTEGLETKTLYSFNGKHLYLHFFDPSSERSIIEIQLLKEMYDKYHPYVQFVSICDEEKYKDSIPEMELITWDMYKLPASNPIWKNFAVENFPHYSLLDAAGYIVASPSLGPTPNGQYETIDRTFYQIKMVIEEENK